MRAMAAMQAFYGAKADMEARSGHSALWVCGRSLA